MAFLSLFRSSKTRLLDALLNPETEVITGDFRKVHLSEEEVDQVNVAHRERRHPLEWRNVNVYHSSLQRLSLHEVTINKVNFFGTNLNAMQLYGGSEVNTLRCENCKMENMVWEDTTLGNARFHNTNLNNTHFENVTFRSSSFNEGSLHEAQFKNCIIEYLRFDSTKMNKCSLEKCNGDLFNAKRITGEKMVLKKSSLKNSYITKSHLPSLSMTDVSLENVRFDGSYMASSTIERFSAIRSHLDYVDLSDSDISEVWSLKETTFIGANFTKARLKEITRKKANFWGANFDRCGYFTGETIPFPAYKPSK